MPTKLISVLCVTENRPAFLEQAVRWFQAYAWPKKELIVVDSSAPGKWLDLSAYANVRHELVTERNVGVKHNIAVALSQGDILCYQDDDDWFHPRRLTAQAVPIAVGEATITGYARSVVVRLPDVTFWRFKPAGARPPAAVWLKNGVGRYRLSIHDGTAMFHRSVLRHGVAHPPYTVRQKVAFLDALVEAGEKYQELKNDGMFVYVRHFSNTWQFDEAVLDPIGKPWWLADSVMDFWRSHKYVA